MIQRSCRNLLITLSRGFAKDNKKVFGNKKKDSQSTSPVNKKQGEDHQQQNLASSEGKTQRKKSSQKQPRQPRQPREQKDKKEKPVQNKAKDKVKESKTGKFEWQKTITKKKEQDLQIGNMDKIRKYVGGLLAQNKQQLEAQLTKDIEAINQPQNSRNLAHSIKAYLEKDPKAGVLFIDKLIPSIKATSKQGGEAYNTIVSEVVRTFVQQEDLEGLSSFIQKLQAKQGQNKGNFSDLSIFKIISELEQSQTKHKALTNLLKFATTDNSLKPEQRQKLEPVIKTIFQKFITGLDQQTSHKRREQLEKSFSELLKIVIQNNLIPLKYLRYGSSMQLIDRLYFNKCSESKYEELFKYIRALKTTVVTQEDQLEEFYKNFMTAIENGKLKSTDCEETPLPINAFLLKNYNGLMKEKKKNKASIVASVAISLLNRYLSIPEHFLVEAGKSFGKQLPKSLISIIKEDFKLLQLGEYMKNPQKYQKEIKSLTVQISESTKPLHKLKVAIITKNYEAAMKIFHTQLYKKLCLTKQIQIIRRALLKFAKEQGPHIQEQQVDVNMFMQQMKDSIDKFAFELDAEYLWESWKKSEDIGYLLQDYYIKDGEQDSASKAQKRFSFWQTYFQAKRAKQISKFQILGQLSTIREPNPQPLLQNQFNLNKYLSPQNYDNYRQLADYTNKRETQLEQYFNKVQYILDSLGENKDNEIRPKILEYQGELCVENLKILQDFGIKDYNIEIHDEQQLRNRISQYKKSRGVLRKQDIYNRIFDNQDNYDILGSEKDAHYLNTKKIMKGEININWEIDADVLREMEEDDDTNTTITKEEIKDALAGKEGEEAASETQAKLQAGAEEAIKQVSGKAAEQASQQAAGQVAEQGAENSENAENPAVETAPDAVTEQTGPLHISEKTPTLYQNRDAKYPRQFTKQFVDLLRVKRNDLFSQAVANVKLKNHPLTLVLMRWGLLNRQPMAIYMAQKLAMLTGQVIPHQLAIRVSDMLNYHRQIDQNLNLDCKKCLTFIGKINRENIYDNNYEYHHIIERPILTKMVSKFSDGLSSRVQALVMTVPSKMEGNMEPREVSRRVGQGPLL